MRIARILVLGATLLGSCELVPVARNSARRSGSGSSGVVEAQSGTFRDLKQHTFFTSREEGAFWASLLPGEGGLAFMLLDTSKRSSPSQDIYVKDINGRAKVQKTFHSAEDSFPAVSPDGQKLAFCSRRNGNWDVFITTLDSGRAVRQVTFTEADEIAPSWSRDGERLAYCKQSQSTDDWEIWITDLTQGSWTSLAPGLFPRFSSSHGLLTFQRTDSSGYSSIWTIDELGKRETQVISSAEESFITPSWSPDGQKIVFASIGKAFAPRQAWKRSRPDDVETLRAADLWTIDADGNNLTQLTGHEADDWAPVWGADGRVYFSSSRDGQTNIWSAIPEFVDIRPASLDTSVDD